MILPPLIADYADSITGCWLECFDWRRVRIKPMRLKIEGVVTASYRALTHTVKVAPDTDDRVWFGSLMHEYYHAYQRERMGLVSYLLAKTFDRSQLEVPAKRAELDATRWIGDYKIQKWKENHDKRPGV